MAKRDYYEVLEVTRTATLKEIKTSYRRLAVQYHPDRNPGDGGAEERFKEAAEAYSVLSDDNRRQRYDRFGHESGAGMPGGGFDPTVFHDFSDILGDLFGFGDRGRRRGGGRRATAGADLRYDLEISFEEAAFGVEPTLKIPRLERCDTCSGSGSREGTAPSPCSACGGRGQVAFSQGFFTVARTCPQCQGEGSLITDPCEDCRGEGRVEQERSIQVTIPGGVDTGARLRLAHEGEHGRHGGPPGDLYVVVHVAEHERLKRRGYDVITSESIGYSQAVLGAVIEVETLHGTKELKIPAGTGGGEVFRIRGEGVDRLERSGRGDHYVEVSIAVPVPKELDGERIELLRRLSEIEGRPVREDKGVLDRVKDLFGAG